MIWNPTIHIDELHSENAAELQSFLERNSEYFLICHGEPARTDEAVNELELRLPDVFYTHALAEGPRASFA